MVVGQKSGSIFVENQASQPLSAKRLEIYIPHSYW